MNNWLTIQTRLAGFLSRTPRAKRAVVVFVLSETAWALACEWLSYWERDPVKVDAIQFKEALLLGPGHRYPGRISGPIFSDLDFSAHLILPAPFDASP